MTRIIAGLAKGRRLAVPPSGTRPTSDRAREGLFNSLAASTDLEDARVLDLFAGTGAVGLEALSRGASTAVLVEADARAAGVLRRNVTTVGLPGAEVVQVRAHRYVADTDDAPFDVVFADPPYALDGPELATLIDAAVARVLAPDGVVVVETSARTDLRALAIPVLTWTAQKRYGEALLWYGRAR